MKCKILKSSPSNRYKHNKNHEIFNILYQQIIIINFNDFPIV